MSKQQKIHLFNCDQTYKLGAVEDWINTAKSKRELELTTKEHYFSLSQMTKLSSETIPELDMDVAVFVVHAHESRLSINEENAGIGYAIIYRALLQKTESKVIIVIGGDDSYKDEDEEDREFISRWSRRKISSQFSEEFMDGRKSFIFSWDKKHREIHEKALLHFLDPNKKGKKFEYQPPAKRQLPLKPTTPPPARRSEPEAFSRPYSSSPAEGPYTGERVQSNKPVVPVESKAHQTSDQGARPKGNRSSSIETKGKNGKKFEYQPPAKRQLPLKPTTPPPVRRSEPEAFSRPYSSLPAEEPFTGERVQSTKPEVPLKSKADTTSDQGARPKDNRSSSTETKDLVVLGCSVSEKSIYAVMQHIEDIRPKLNLQATPPVKNLFPAEVKKYLERNWLKFCVLVVDAETVKDAYENLPERRADYEALLKTAVDRVAEKVIILVYDNLPLPKEDETIVNKTINRIVKERGKGFVAWLKNGKLTVKPDDLVQFLLRSKPLSHMIQQSRRPERSRGSSNVHSSSATESRQTYVDQPWAQSEMSYGSEKPNMQKPQGAIQQYNLPANTTYNRHDPSIGKLMLKSKLRYGRISYEEGDLVILSPEFQGVDYNKAQSLFNNFVYIAETQVLIVSDPKDNTVAHVIAGCDLGIAINDNEILMLRTRVRKGLVSLHEDDLEIRYPGWTVPVHILEDLKRKESEGKLFIISDEKGNLRCKVQSGVKDKAVAVKDKAVSMITSPFKKSHK